MSNMSSTSFSSFLDHVPKILFIFLIISVAGLEISIALSSIAFGIAGVLFIVLLSYRKEYRFRTPLDYAMLAYCIVELLATIFSIDRPASIINMKRLFFMAFVLITIISCSDEQR